MDVQLLYLNSLYYELRLLGTEDEEIVRKYSRYIAGLTFDWTNEMDGKVNKEKFLYTGLTCNLTFRSPEFWVTSLTGQTVGIRW